MSQWGPSRPEQCSAIWIAPFYNPLYLQIQSNTWNISQLGRIKVRKPITELVLIPKIWFSIKLSWPDDILYKSDIKLKSQPKLLHSAQPLMQKPQHNSKSINPMGSLVDFNLIAVRDWHNWERLQFLIGINYFFHIFLRCDGRWAGRGISTIWLAEACDVNDYPGRYFNLPRNFADRIHSQNKDRSSLNPQKLKVFSFQPKALKNHANCRKIDTVMTTISWY